MSEVKSVLGVDISPLVGGMDKAGDAVGDFAERSKKELEGITDSANGVTEATEASSQKQSQSWGRVNKVVAGIALVSGGLFKSMVDASPGLSAAFAEMDFMMEEVFMVLGEALAPLIEDTIVPLVEKLTDFILGLDEGTLEFIATGIALVAGLTIASSVMGMFGLSMTALLGPVGLVIIGIAALALAYHTNFGGIKDTLDGFFGDAKAGLSDFMEKNKDTFDAIGAKVGELVDFLEPFIKFFVEVMVDRMRWAFDSIMIIVGGIIDFFSGFLDFIIGIFTLDFDRALGGLEDMFRSVIDTIIGLWDRFWEYIDDLIADVKGLFSGFDMTEFLTKFVQFFVDMGTTFSDGWDSIILGATQLGIDIGLELGTMITDIIAWGLDVIGALKTPFVNFGLALAQIWLDIQDGIGGGVTGVVEIIDSLVTALINFIIDGINFLITNPINSLLDVIIGWDITNSETDATLEGIKLKGIPRLHDGGTVPGPIGAEVPIIALGGEQVYNPMKGQQAPTGNGGGGVTMRNVFNFYHTQLPDRMAEKKLMSRIDKGMRKLQNKYPSGRGT